MKTDFDIVVIGAGHAGCEAAAAAARLGCRVLLTTIDLNSVAYLACNPSVGGVGKSHLVYEIDALGGLMAQIADRTCIQMRTLNRGNGPAVQALRAQVDKHAYHAELKAIITDDKGNDIPDAYVLVNFPTNKKATGDIRFTVETIDGRYIETIAEVWVFEYTVTVIFPEQCNYIGSFAIKFAVEDQIDQEILITLVEARLKSYSWVTGTIIGICVTSLILIAGAVAVTIFIMRKKTA